METNVSLLERIASLEKRLEEKIEGVAVILGSNFAIGLILMSGKLLLWR